MAVAVAFMLAASAIIAATSLLAKALGLAGAEASGLSPFQVSAGRFVFAFLTLLMTLGVTSGVRLQLSGARWSWHLVRSVCGWCAATCTFAAVTMMPVAEATAISFLGPLVTVLLATVLLGERIVARVWLAVGMAFCGALLIVRPGTEAFQVAGLFALAGAGFMGLEAIYIKKLSGSEPALRILVINNAIGAAVSSVIACFVWVWPTGLQWCLLVALGVIMVAGQALFIQSMKRSEASRIIPVFYAVLVFAAAYDFILYGVRPTSLAIAGAGLIVLAAAFLTTHRPSGGG